jgi:hypothetical protein
VRSSTVIVTVSDFCRKGFVTRRRGVETFRFSDCHDGVDVVAYPIRSVFRRNLNIRVPLEKVHSINLDDSYQKIVPVVLVCSEPKLPDPGMEGLAIYTPVITSVPDPLAFLNFPVPPLMVQFSVLPKTLVVLLRHSTPLSEVEKICDPSELKVVTSNRSNKLYWMPLVPSGAVQLPDGVVRVCDNPDLRPGPSMLVLHSPLNCPAKPEPSKLTFEVEMAPEQIALYRLPPPANVTDAVANMTHAIATAKPIIHRFGFCIMFPFAPWP